MDIGSLHNFILVVETGSFYRAAERTNMTPQGLNKCISTLEAELGIKLVTRSRSGVRTTSCGDIFLRRARNITREYDEMTDELAAEGMSVAYPEAGLSIHTTYYLMQLFTGLVGIQSIPASISFSEAPLGELVMYAKHMEENVLVVAECCRPTLENLLADNELTIERLFTTRVGVVARNDSPFARHEMLHRSDLKSSVFSCNSHRELRFIRNLIFKDISLNETLSTTNTRFLLEFARDSPEHVALYDSFGFALSQADANMPTDDLTFTPISTPDAEVAIVLMYPYGQPPNKRIRRGIIRSMQRCGKFMK